MSHVVVLGAGVIGVTTAWFLREAGYAVSVIERQPEAARETSFANGSQISISYAQPWANPQAPGQILASLGRRDAALQFKARWDPQQWAWALAFLRECLPQRSLKNTEHITRLGLYSREALLALRASQPLDYDALSLGVLHLFETDRECEAARPAMAMMHALGCPLTFVSVSRAVEIEPALLTMSPQLAGAAHAPEDESGDAYKFTQQLAALAQHAGVTFYYGAHVTGLARVGTVIEGVSITTPAGSQVIRADHTVVAMGSWSAPFLRPYGLPLRIYPAKGYSATIPILKAHAVTRVSLTDHRRKLVFSRLGERLRVAGTAQFTGYDTRVDAHRCKMLVARAASMFPGALDVDAARFWAGLRPATPSNVPYIGRSHLNRLWLNTGHGTLGWTHAAGSAKALTCLINGDTPGLEFPFLRPSPSPGRR